MGETCDMVIIEDADMKYWWECSECKTNSKATSKFEKSKTCPSCGKEIANWIGVDDGRDE
jgi:rRNA maturation endonuclease Nob1